LAVTFASNTTPVCAVSGLNVTLVTVGTCSITASQAGNATWAAAAPVTRTFTVSSKAQTITFGTLVNRTMGPDTFAPFGLSATASSGLTVTFASNSTPVCTVSGVEVTLAGAGICSITASQPGNSTWAPAPSVTQTFLVNKAQTITFGALSNRALGTAPFALVATASSGLAVTFASHSASVCTVSGSTVTLVAAGACSISASQPGNSTWAAATEAFQTFSITGSEGQTITFANPGGQMINVNPALVATASSGLAITFTSNTTSICTVGVDWIAVSGFDATLIAAGTCTITASQAGNASYAAATPVVRSFTVAPTQTISFAALPNVVLGVAPFTVSAAATSGLAVSFASTTKSVCTLAGKTVTLVAVGTCTILATQAGNSTFNAAAPVSRSFQVTPGQIIAFPNPGKQMAGTRPALIATASSGLAITFTSNSTSICTVGVDWVAVSGSDVVLIAAGTCSITASQPGNATWPAATAVTQTFAVFTGNQ
jgi:hypothetical protein